MKVKVFTKKNKKEFNKILTDFILIFFFTIDMKSGTYDSGKITIFIFTF